jgi:hypothetical protein
MTIRQKAVLSILVAACVVGSVQDGIRILTMLSTLVLASYVRAARLADRF